MSFPTEPPKGVPTSFFAEVDGAATKAKGADAIVDALLKPMVEQAS